MELSGAVAGDTRVMGKASLPLLDCDHFMNVWHFSLMVCFVLKSDRADVSVLTVSFRLYGISLLGKSAQTFFYDSLATCKIIRAVMTPSAVRSVL